MKTFLISYRWEHQFSEYDKICHHTEIVTADSMGDAIATVFSSANESKRTAGNQHSLEMRNVAILLALELDSTSGLMTLEAALNIYHGM